MSTRYPIRLGSPLKNHTCEQALASSMWPRRSRRTRERVTSTPHLSQITPRCFMRLYLPHKHSQSATGPKVRAQNNPSGSGVKVRELIVSGLVTSRCDLLRSFKRLATLLPIEIQCAFRIVLAFGGDRSVLGGEVPVQLPAPFATGMGSA